MPGEKKSSVFGYHLPKPVLHSPFRSCCAYTCLYHGVFFTRRVRVNFLASYGILFFFFFFLWRYGGVETIAAPAINIFFPRTSNRSMRGLYSRSSLRRKKSATDCLGELLFLRRIVIETINASSFHTHASSNVSQFPARGRDSFGRITFHRRKSLQIAVRAPFTATIPCASRCIRRRISAK